MGQTFAQKVLAKKAGLPSVAVGQIVDVEPDVCLSHDNTAAIAKTFAKFGVDRVKNPERFVIVLDHTVPASTEEYAQGHKEIRAFVEKQGIKAFYDAGVGICHQVLPERALPCRAGSSSARTRTRRPTGRSAPSPPASAAPRWPRSCHVEDLAQDPGLFEVEVKGKLQEPVTSKDLVLKIIGDIGADGALYKSVEFAGEAIEAMSLSSASSSRTWRSRWARRTATALPTRRRSPSSRAAPWPIHRDVSDPDAEYERNRYDV